MNLIIAGFLLFGMLAVPPTLIHSSEKLAFANAAVNNNNKRLDDYKPQPSINLNEDTSLPLNSKIYVPAAETVSKSAKLLAKRQKPADETDVISLRPTRDVTDPNAAAGTADEPKSNNNNNNDGAVTLGAGTGGSVSGKRTKNAGNHKKSNRNPTMENASTNGERKQLSDKKFSAATGSSGNGTSGNTDQQVHRGNNNNHNGKNKQRQLLKSQLHQQHQHQTHGKRLKSKAENAVDGAKPTTTCRYTKSAWSECDVKTNIRTRTLTLKKGEANCLPTRTMQKKCKKVCRYDKGAWSECSNGQMTRQDKLKTTAGINNVETNCEALRTINKKCGNGGTGKHLGGKGNKERKNKDKASRRSSAQAQLGI